VLRNCVHQDAALCLQAAGDDIFQLQHFGTSRIKQRKLSLEVPDYPRLTHTNNLEVLQHFLSCSQLLHLLLSQLTLPICHLHSPGIQGVLLEVSSKLMG
jgi:hypothetical protein